MKSLILVASLLSLMLSNYTIAAQETTPPNSPPSKEKTGELQKRCAENPQLCQDKKAQHKQKRGLKDAWCKKYSAPCAELKPIQSQPPSPAKRQARQAWCKKNTEACAELKKLNQTVPQSQQ